MARCTQLNPRLIYCSISGYGQTGPSAELPAYAPVIHAASGYDMAHLAYQPGRTRPDYCGIYHADVLTGVYAFGAISAALYQRNATGQGQHIDVSMLESMLSLTLNEVQWSQFAVKPTPRPMFGPIETSDGYVMMAIASEKTFQSLMQVIGHPGMDQRSALCEICRPPRKLGEPDGRRRGVVAHGDDRRNASPSSTRTAFPHRPIAPSPRRWPIRRLAHRGALAEVEDGGGTFKVLNLPFRMSGAKVSAAKRMSTLGEHTRGLPEGDRPVGG